MTEERERRTKESGPLGNTSIPFKGSSSTSKEMTHSERLEKLGREIEGLSLTDQKSLVSNVVTQMKPQDKREIANEASIPRPGRETANTIWLIVALIVAAIALLISLAAIIYAVIITILNPLVLLTVFIFIAVIFAAIVIPRQSFALILPAITRGYERGYELLEKNSGKTVVESHALPAPSEEQAD